MEDKEWLEAVQQLEKKLARAQKRGAVLYQKAKLLEEIVDIAKRHEDDAREREHDAGALIRQLITRQRELNVMLNRSNILVARMYEANQTMSLEFKEAAKALPAPEREKVEQKVTASLERIDQLFKKTGIPDAQTTSSPAQLQDPGVIDATADHSFTIDSSNPRRDGLWSHDKSDTPTLVEAEAVEEHPDGGFTVRASADHPSDPPVQSVIDHIEPETDEERAGGEITDDRRRKWWARFGFGSNSG